MLSRTALLKGYTSEPVVFDSVGMKTLFEVEKMAKLIYRYCVLV